MPRLLILCEYPTLLGGERSMLSTLPAIQAAGFDVLIAAPRTGQLAIALGEAGVEIVPWETHDDTGKRRPLPELRKALSTIIERVQPKLIHANSLSTSRIAGPVAASALIRSIGHLRDIIRLNAQSVDDINKHDRIVAVSAATRNFHIAQGLDATKCVVLRNGVDLAIFRIRPPSGYLHAELGLPLSVRLIATVGQLGLRKGVDVAIRAAAIVAQQLPDIHWLFVGERTSNKSESVELEKLLHDRATRPPLAGRVHFLGQRNDMPQLLTECTALVHAARQEPLGRILLESAASGLAIIATDVGGTREIFPAASTSAILIPPDEVAALAAATMRVLTDEDLRRRLSDNARRRAEAAFDIRDAAERLVATYRSIIR